MLGNYFLNNSPLGFCEIIVSKGLACCSLHIMGRCVCASAGARNVGGILLSFSLPRRRIVQYCEEMPCFSCEKGHDIYTRKGSFVHIKTTVSYVLVFAPAASAEIARFKCKIRKNREN